MFVPKPLRPRKDTEFNHRSNGIAAPNLGDRVEFGQAQQGYDHRERHAGSVYCDYDPIKQRASPAPKKKSRAQALLKNCVDPISPKSGFDLD
jgi:hypothetical protein